MYGQLAASQDCDCTARLIILDATVSSPLNVKLTCRSWQQLSAIHSRDLSRGAFFLKTKKPPALGTAIRISLILPSGSTVELKGTIKENVPEGGMDGRGPGIDIALATLPKSVMWLIESALSAAGITPRPIPDSKEIHSPPPPPTKEEVEAGSPDLSDGDEWVEAESELVKALWDELGSMSKMNAFQLLNLSYEATDEEVRRSFGELSKKYHPDRFTRYESFEIRELANEVFILLRDAYRKLATEPGRTDALKEIDAKRGTGAPASKNAAVPPPTPPPPPTVPGDATAQGQGPKRTAEPGTGSSPVAITPESKTRAPTAPESAGGDRVAMAMNVLESGQYEQALRILRAEVRKNPDNPVARAGVELAEGRLALANGDRMEAAERFEAALDIDPSNERAAREIAEMRRYATSQRKGLLSKLMKKV